MNQKPKKINFGRGKQNAGNQQFVDVLRATKIPCPKSASTGILLQNSFAKLPKSSIETKRGTNQPNMTNLTWVWGTKKNNKNNTQIQPLNLHDAVLHIDLACLDVFVQKIHGSVMAGWKIPHFQWAIYLQVPHFQHISMDMLIYPNLLRSHSTKKSPSKKVGKTSIEHQKWEASKIKPLGVGSNLLKDCKLSNLNHPARLMAGVWAMQ